MPGTTTTTTTCISPISNAQTKELSPGFGAEVCGLDFSRGVNTQSSDLIKELVKKVR